MSSVGSGVNAGTRDRLAALVGQEGPITVADLADRLGLTPAAVRRHMDVMAQDGLVHAREVIGKRGRGRPAKAYVLSRAGHAQLPAGYDDLAAQALTYLAERFGAEATAGFARQRVAALEERLRPQVEAAGASIAERAAALALALDQEGFAASVRPVAEGTPAYAVQLCQGHCPVQRVAAQFPELCEAETEAIARLVGVNVRRLATLAHGDHVCTTHIPVGAVRHRAGTRPPPGQPAQDRPGRVHDLTSPTTAEHSTTAEQL